MILIITHQADHYTVDLVAGHLAAMGRVCRRLNMDTYPLGFTLSAAAGAQGSNCLVQTPEWRASTGEVTATWLRKYWAPPPNPEVEPAYRQPLQREAQEVLDLVLRQLGQGRMMDPWQVVRQASDKHLQLQVAVQEGLRVPATLISNDHGQVMDFAAALGKPICAKLLTGLSATMDGSGMFLYTQLLSPEDLAHPELVSLHPMCFQEYIPKLYELRIAYVDGQCFTGKMDASGSPTGRVDWRQARPDEVRWEPYALPRSVEEALCRLMGRLGLHFGAVDVLRAPSGDYVFLEVNPIGEWGMLERDLGLPISRAIAEWLAKS